MKSTKNAFLNAKKVLQKAPSNLIDDLRKSKNRTHKTEIKTVSIRLKQNSIRIV